MTELSAMTELLEKTELPKKTVLSEKTLQEDKALQKKSIYRVAIVGNPNSGKTTLFNALTGLNYKVANYPGVTVERREAALKLSSELTLNLVDLPGLYSFSSLSIDEQIASNEVL